MITFDPSNGDLGRAKIRPVSALEIRVLVPHIAHILEELAISELSTQLFKYAFELSVHERDSTMLVIRESIYKLPPHVFWYEVDGNRLFEIRGASGGVVASYICYLVTK